MSFHPGVIEKRRFVSSLKEKKRIDFSEKLVYQSDELFFAQAVRVHLRHLMNR